MWEGTTVSWYSKSRNDMQFNENGFEYQYLAFT